MLRRSLFFVSLSFALACGGGKEQALAPVASADPAPAKAEPASEAKEAPKEEAPGALPTECAGSGEVCTPSKAFADKLCQDVWPTVALHFFRAGTPWTRGYLKGKTEAWNASGGASVAGWLEFDEEVIILKHRPAPKGGMQVSGAGGGYEALRLNGACVTLSGEEVTLRKPPKAKYPKLEWKWLEVATRDVLTNDTEISETDKTRRKECKGATMGEVSDKCVKADQKLSDLVASYVTGGGELPKPEKLP